MVGVDRSHVDSEAVRPFELERLIVRDVDLLMPRIARGRGSLVVASRACVRACVKKSPPSRTHHLIRDRDSTPGPSLGVPRHARSFGQIREPVRRFAQGRAALARPHSKFGVPDAFGRFDPVEDELFREWVEVDLAAEGTAVEACVAWVGA